MRNKRGEGEDGELGGWRGKLGKKKGRKAAVEEERGSEEDAETEREKCVADMLAVTLCYHLLF